MDEHFKNALVVIICLMLLRESECVRERERGREREIEK
jgi:hypothetical protein